MWVLAVSSLLVAALRADHQQKTNPVEKVTSLLKKLQAEIEAEGKAEALAYDKYACFCKEQAGSKQYAIEKFTKAEELLKAQIEDKTASRDELNNEIGDLQADIAKGEAEMLDAQYIRGNTTAEYSERAAMLSKAISAIKRAIEALEASRNSVEANAALLKYDAVIKNSLALMGSENKDAMKLLKLMQQPPAKAYSFQSNEVIATLQSLLKVFKQKKVEADQSEQSDRQEHEMQAGARRNTIKGLEKSVGEKQEQSAALDEEINTHSTDLQETEAAHGADQNFLNDLTAKCEQKASDWDQRSTTRTQELTAITQAMEMLKNDVSKVYESSTGLGLVVRKRQAQAKRVEKPHFTATPQSNTPRPPAAVGGHWQWVPDKKASAHPVSFLQVDRPATAAKKAKAALKNAALVLPSIDV